MINFMSQSRFVSAFARNKKFINAQFLRPPPTIIQMPRIHGDVIILNMRLHTQRTKLIPRAVIGNLGFFNVKASK